MYSNGIRIKMKEMNLATFLSAVERLRDSMLNSTEWRKSKQIIIIFFEIVIADCAIWHFNFHQLEVCKPIWLLDRLYDLEVQFKEWIPKEMPRFSKECILLRDFQARYFLFLIISWSSIYIFWPFLQWRSSF